MSAHVVARDVRFKSKEMKWCFTSIVTAGLITSCSTANSTDYSKIRREWQWGLRSGKYAAKDEAYVVHDVTAGRFYLHGKRRLYVPKAASMTSEEAGNANGNLGVIASEFLCSYVQIGKIGISVLSRPDPKYDSSIASIIIMDRTDSVRVMTLGTIDASGNSQTAPPFNPTGRLPIEQVAAGNRP